MMVVTVALVDIYSRNVMFLLVLVSGVVLIMFLIVMVSVNVEVTEVVIVVVF